MKKSVLLIFVLTIFLTSSDLQAAQLLKSQDSELNIGGRLQMLGVIESLYDEHKDDQRITLFLKQSRIRIDGNIKGVNFNTELMFGGEEVPKSNSVMSLLESYVDFHLFNCPFTGKPFSLRTGQFKVPYSREELVYDGDLDNMDRSIQNLGFKLGRDVGLELYTQSGKFAAGIGVFTGGGMNLPQRYLPTTMGIPLTALRIGFNNGLDKDALTPHQTERSGKTKYAAYLNAVYSKDIRLGHGSSLSTKYTDYSLLLNKNWNPYISSVVSAAPTGKQRTFEQAEFWQAGTDISIEIPVGAKSALEVTFEANTGGFTNSKGAIKLTGGVLKGNLDMEKAEFGLRYAALFPDGNFAYYGGTPAALHKIINTDTIHEIAPSIVVNISRNMKLVMDAPIGLNTPVAVEGGHGVYNLMMMPDSTSSANPNAIVGFSGQSRIESQTTLTGRMVLQVTY